MLACRRHRWQATDLRPASAVQPVRALRLGLQVLGRPRRDSHRHRFRPTGRVLVRAERVRGSSRRERAGTELAVQVRSTHRDLRGVARDTASHWWPTSVAQERRCGEKCSPSSRSRWESTKLQPVQLRTRGDSHLRVAPEDACSKARAYIENLSCEALIDSTAIDRDCCNVLVRCLNEQGVAGLA